MTSLINHCNSQVSNINSILLYQPLILAAYHYMAVLTGFTSDMKIDNSSTVQLYMTQVSNKQLDTNMSKQLNTMLIISHKHYINTKSRDSTLLCLLCDGYYP